MSVAVSKDMLSVECQFTVSRCPHQVGFINIYMLATSLKIDNQSDFSPNVDVYVKVVVGLSPI